MNPVPDHSRRTLLAGSALAAALALTPGASGKAKKRKNKKKPLIGYCVGTTPNVGYYGSAPPRVNVSWLVRCLDLRVEPAVTMGETFVGSNRNGTSRSMVDEMLPTIATVMFSVPASQASRIKLELF